MIKLIQQSCIFCVVIGLNTLCDANVPLQWNPVIIDSVKESPHVEWKRFQEMVDALQPEIEQSVYKGNAFIPLQGVQNQDELLIAFVTVTNLNLQQWSSTKNLSHLVFFRMAANLQIVDPVSGQVVYSISDYFHREDWDQNGSPADEIAMEKLTLHKKDRDTNKITQLDWNDRSNKRIETSVDQTSVFVELLKLGIQEMIQTAKREFQPSKIHAQIAFAPKTLPGRRIRRRSTDPYVLNKGRLDGVYSDMVLYSNDKRTFVQITESYPNYSLAQNISGQPAKQWDTFQSYKMDMGHSEAQALASVTRILFSDDLLQHPDAVFLNESENAIRKELGESQNANLHIPVYHVSYSSLLNSAMLKTGKVKMTYPLIGLIELDNTKINLQEIWNKLEIERYSSYIRPDFGVTAIVSNLAKTTEEIPGGHRITYKVLVSVHLYDLRTGEIIVSGQAQKGRRYDRVEAMGITVQELDTPVVLINRIIRDGITEAVKNLGENYQPRTSLARASFVNAAGVQLEFDRNEGLYIGKRFGLSTKWMDTGLVEGSSVNTPVFKRRAELILSQKNKTNWNALVNFANLTLPEVKESFVPMYGVNQKQVSSAQLEKPIQTVKTNFNSGIASIISKEEISLLVFAHLSSHSNVALRFSQPMQKRLLEFHAQKYAYEQVFEEVEDFAEDTQSLDLQAMESMTNWDNYNRDGFQIVVDISAASARRVSQDRYKTKKDLDININMNVTVMDQNSAIYKPVNLHVKTKKTVEYNSIEGNEFVRQVFYDYMPNVIKVLCTKRIQH